MNNIFIGRLRRSVKYEEVYLKDYANAVEDIKDIDRNFHFYNTQNREVQHTKSGGNKFSTLKKPIFCLNKRIYFIYELLSLI